MTEGAAKKVLIPIHDPSSPYYLHPSEGPGNFLMKYLLRGDNFDTWEKAVCNALKGRGKAKFLVPDGFPKLSDDLEYAAWESNNSIICAWILNSVDESVQPSIMSHSAAHELWSDLKSRYGGSNGPRVHQLKTEICKCAAAALIRADVEHEKTHMFLLDLDDEQYRSARSQILGTEPVPDISRVYSLVAREERHCSIVRARDDRMGAMAFAVGRAPPPVHYQCTHCGKIGHTVDCYYQIIGFPGGRGAWWWQDGPWWSDRRTGDQRQCSSWKRGDDQCSDCGGVWCRAIQRGYPGVVVLRSSDTSSLDAQPFVFQYDVEWYATVHFQSSGDCLVDSAASHHMTGTISFLLDVCPIPSCPITLLVKGNHARIGSGK
ncbi:unnamed protein product [Cuscuta campestris]|uniref:Retrotransposon Copia-like N-terminal domain-containing protein n=1 Tax=Cuscuta campestris TaxID=132261 RepID=A0A484LLA4_9ASTE|nr:unnamed protein product [Cuscuta campestris]